MERRSYILLGIGLVAAALIASYSAVHRKAIKRDLKLESRAAGDPWASSPWITDSHKAPLAASAASSNSKAFGPRARKLEATGLATSGSEVEQRAPSAGIMDGVAPETGDHALNVKWPPSAPMSRSNVPGRRPRGWGLISTAYAAANCRFTADDNYVHTGSFSALLQYDGADPKLRCFFGQVSLVGAFGGHRVQFSAFLAGRDVVGGAGLIFRADDSEGNIVAYNFTGQPTLKGSQPWSYDTVIVDVPESATRLYYGAWLAPGGGSLWVDTMEFFVVDNSFPVTHPPPARANKSGAPLVHQPPSVPSNLDFEVTDPIP
jgi:hypothetical protein